MTADESRPWGEALKILRVIRGWRPEDLATAAGLKPRSIKGYERGERPIPVPPRRLASMMGFPPALLDRTVEFVERARIDRAGAASRNSEERRRVRIAVVAARLGESFEDGVRIGLSRSVLAMGAGVEASAEPLEEGPRQPWGEAVTILRVIRQITQRELEAAGFRRGAISQLERGPSQRSPETLRRVVEAMGFAPEMLGRTLAFVQAARATLGGSDLGSAAPALKARITELAADEGRAMERFVRGRLERLMFEGQLLGERHQASALWKKLGASPEEQRRELVRERPEFQTAGFCELLCEESIRAAGDSAQRARSLAQLAVDVAERVVGEEGWRARIQGYAWAHLASATRVAGDHLGAVAGFERGAELWKAGAGDDPGLLNEARVLGLRASLLRERRRLPEAIALFDRALAIDRWGEKASLLMGKAKAVAKLGQFDEAISLLRQADSQVDGEREPRKLWVVRQLLLFNLCHLGRHGEAQLMLGEVRALARRLGNRLDLLRMDWVQGIIAAGMGQYDEAIQILQRVRAKLIKDEIAYDAALVTVELAEARASLGDTAEVKKLARESAHIFQAQGVHREAQAALEVFRQAAEREAVTAEMIRRLVLYLYRAQSDPQLRFEAAA